MMVCSRVIKGAVINNVKYIVHIYIIMYMGHGIWVLELRAPRGRVMKRDKAHLITLCPSVLYRRHPLRESHGAAQ